MKKVWSKIRFFCLAVSGSIGAFDLFVGIPIPLKNYVYPVFLACFYGIPLSLIADHFANYVCVRKEEYKRLKKLEKETA